MLQEFKGRFSRRVSKGLSERGRRMANARWAKWRAEAASRPEPEPKMQRWYPLAFGVRDKTLGVECWMDLRSLRDVTRRLAVLLRYYQPGVPDRGGGKNHE
jgi:hypothetical protein